MKLKRMTGVAALAFGLLLAQLGFTSGATPALASEKANSGSAKILKTDKEIESYSLGVEMGKKFVQQKAQADPDLAARGLQDAMRDDKAQKSAPPPVFKTDKEKESYNLGGFTGKSFKEQRFDVDPALVARGMKDAMKGEKLLLTEEELGATMEVVRAQARVLSGRDRLIAALDNKEQGEAFLAANKTKEGVVALPSGLQYKIIDAGKGEKPTEADTVECEYRGTLINGTEFDKTVRPTPLSLADRNVILGLREALKLMPVGSRWQLFIPSQLAYVGRGTGRIVGPNATLIFDMKLLAITPDKRG